jgi:plasmid stability protein
MKTIQYTIRNIPEPVNRYLRKRASLSGKSLNQVIIDELSEKVITPSASIGAALDWFIGSGMDDATLQALEEEDKKYRKN